MGIGLYSHIPEVFHQVIAGILGQWYPIVLAETSPNRENQDEINTGVAPHVSNDGEGVPVQERRQPQEQINLIDLAVTNPSRNSLLDRSARRSVHAIREATSEKNNYRTNNIRHISGYVPGNLRIPPFTGHLNVRRYRS